ncbi:MAG: ribbon-helix-helix protein, CopG family [Thermoanaerobaculia bacterium]
MTLWLDSDEAETLRVRAFTERRTRSELVREALRRFLNIEDQLRWST